MVASFRHVPGHTARWVALVAALVLAGLVCALPFFPAPVSADAGYVLEIGLASKYDVVAEVFWDQGAGIQAGNSVNVPVAKSETLATIRFPMPAGHYRALRFDPLNAAGEGSFGPARIVDRDNRVVREIPVRAFIAQNDIYDLTVGADAVRFRAQSGDPNFSVDLGRLDLPPLAARTGQQRLVTAAKSVAALLALTALTIGWLVSPVDGLRPRARAAWLWCRDRPQTAVLSMGLLAAVLSCYPLVFLGKSLVSPGFGTSWLYSRVPTLPGAPTVIPVSAHGSDIGAMTWFDVPFTSIERRALFEFHELPLWNRYNDSGNPLLAQGQSMFGDPFHFLTILADSAAWAWDVRFIFARFLIAAGTGLCVWQITRRLGPSLLLALSAPFLGFFLFRVNHPATFSLCYGPWILFAWARLIEARVDRSLARALALWVLANGCMLTSGTVKEAYFLGLTLNFAGALWLLFTPALPGRDLRSKAVAIGVVATGFILLSSPVWLNFLQTLRGSATAYDQPYALQLPPGFLLGFFDEIFLRQSQPQETVLNPAVNGFILIGVLWSIATWRETWALPAGRALSVTIIGCAALVFGAIPPGWITHVPFLANVGHTANTFGCALIILTLALAGLGWSRALDWLRGLRPNAEATGVAILAGLLLALYFGTGQAQYDLTIPRALHFSPFFSGYSLSLLLGAAGLLGAARLALRPGWWTPAAWVVVGLCWIVLHWRMGLHAPTRFERYVLSPPERVSFHGASPAIAWLQQKVAAEPARVAGLQLNLVAGVSGFYGLEGMSGSDPLTQGRYQAFSQAAGLSQRNEWSWTFDANGWAQHRPFYDLLNLRYVVTREVVPAGSALQLQTHADLNVYASTTAWPRAFFTDRVVTYEGLGEFINLVRTSDGRPFAAVPRVETPKWGGLASAQAEPGRAVVAATDYRLGINFTEFTVTNSRPGAVVLTETDRDGDFSVTVDGQRVPRLGMNYAFKGVRLDDAGTHRIRFTYRPHFWTASLLASLVGFIVVGLMGGWLYRRPAAI